MATYINEDVTAAVDVCDKLRQVQCLNVWPWEYYTELDGSLVT